MVPIRLAQFSPTAVAATYYTVAAGFYVVVKNIVVANSLTTAVTLQLSLVPSGGTAGLANRIIPGTAIPGLGTVALDLTQVMNAGDFISALAGSANALAVTISGMREAV